VVVSGSGDWLTAKWGWLSMVAPAGLRGRDRECETLTGLAEGARAGLSRVLVLRGEAGIGKTALLDFLLERSDGCRVSRAGGVESEMELAFSGLHQLCGPFLDRVKSLPDPQRDALETIFGLQSGAPPDRFLVGLAVLSLLSEVAEEQPVVCVVDDAQWLDQASVQTLQFVSRRLGAERVTMVFAARDVDEEPVFEGLPELVVSELNRADATALLDSSLPGRLDAHLRDRILAESRGNPLALLVLPREEAALELTVGVVHAPNRAADLVIRLEHSFLRRLEALPGPSRQLMLLASAETAGDVPLLWRAAEYLDIADSAVAEAQNAGLLEVSDQVRFRHPLVRSAVYRGATPTERRTVHHALAVAMDRDQDPDRRAWHQARAATDPDEAVAAELEAAADRAVARGGLAAAAAFIEASAALTPEPGRRARRMLRSAQAKAAVGAFTDALTLSARAQVGPLDEADGARVELLHAQISATSQRGNQGLRLLLSAAHRLEGIDATLARETYLDALAAAMFAGRLAPGSDTGMRQVAQAMREVRLPAEPAKSDRLLQGIAVLFTDGYAAAAPALHQVVRAFGREELTLDEAVRFAWLAACVAADLWDDVNWDLTTARHLDGIRAVGALGALPLALNSRVIYHLYSGDLAEAEALVAETRAVADITGGQNAMAPYGDACLNAIRGRTPHAEPQMLALMGDIMARGEGVGLNMMTWFQALLYNGVGRYADAFEAARTLAAEPMELGPPKWGLAELVEAGVRSGNHAAAVRAQEQLSAFAQASGTELALGVEAGRKALLQSGDAAEGSYREAIERLALTRLRVEHARAQLRYGEWLRREGRRVDARTQLRDSYDALTAMGVDGFADRAGQELAATGETVRKRSVDAVSQLTPQEAHIARLAADGLTNPEIATSLYLSRRTVEWHLHKVFAKLGITARNQLRRSLLDSLPSAG
jgi:DNA-binding CsgD family transcriptional regulator